MKQETKLNRRFLVETLENLLSDEFDSSELVYETDEQIILRIIEAAEYFRDEYHNSED